MNTKSCDNCKFHNEGVIYIYKWQECEKNWSEKNKPMIGVLKHFCNNWKPKEKGKVD